MQIREYLDQHFLLILFAFSWPCGFPLLQVDKQMALPSAILNYPELDLLRHLSK